MGTSEEEKAGAGRPGYTGAINIHICLPVPGKDKKQRNDQPCPAVGIIWTALNTASSYCQTTAICTGISEPGFKNSWEKQERQAA